MNHKMLIAAIAAASFSAAPALAQGDGEETPPENGVEVVEEAPVDEGAEFVPEEDQYLSVDEIPTFEELDADGNGEISYDEALAIWPDLTEEEFAEFVLPGTEGLSPAEYEAFTRAIITVE